MLLTFLISTSKRAVRSKLSVWLWLAIAVLSCSIPARAQFVTKNAYVEADVSADGQGLVSLFYANTNHLQSIIHPSQTSYLTVLVNGTSYYTNNQHLSLKDTSAFPRNTPTGYLQNGKTNYTGPNKDTIETIWEPQGPNTYEIIQDIYPVTFPIEGSGQIVFRFSIVNLQNTALSVVPQYLLDIELSDGDSVNDGAPITTRYGYMATQWAGYPPTNSVPPYFVATLEALSSEHFPYMLAEGYCNDSLAPEPMNLIEPSLFAFTDWREVATAWTWGFPSSPIQYPTIGDDALLFQWTGGSANAGQPPQVIGSFSYGSPACQPICYGNLDAMMFHPEHIRWDAVANSYVPTHFPVDAIVWNPNITTANNASGTQSITNDATGAVDGPVKIVSPNAPPPVFTQTHNLTGSQIPGQQSTSISWEDTVLPGVLINCSTEMLYDIAFSVAAGGVSGACQNGTYICPVEVDCEEKDVTPPSHSPHVVVGKLNSCGNPKAYSDSVFDSLKTDQGIQSITWYALPTNAAVTVTGIPSPIIGCPRSVGPITVTQVDTVQAPCVYFTFTDCASPPNISYDTICFERCLPPVPFDTLPPRIRLLNRYNQNIGDTTNASCQFQCSQSVVTDSVEFSLPGLQRDGGLDTVGVASATNMSFTLLHPVTLGLKVDTFSVCVTNKLLDGSIVIGAMDSAGNATTYDTITYCTINDDSAPIVVVSQQQLQGSWLVTASETRSWDRGIDSLLLTFVQNCWPVPNPSLFTIDSINDSTCSIHPVSTCPDTLYFVVQIADTFKNACFTPQAWDCAHNKNTSAPYCIQALADNFCPNDSIHHIGSPTSDSIEVFFYDIHPGINYDEGIDTISFYMVHNVSMKYHGGISGPVHGIKEDSTQPVPPEYPVLDSVIFFVTDTTIHDTVPATICWEANDGAGNPLCNSTLCWSYSLAEDTTPPFVTLAYDPCDSLAVTITDVRTLDRGIYRVWDSLPINLTAFDDTDSGATTLSLDLPILDRTKSASAVLLASDVYGHQSTIPKVQGLHTDTLNLGVYRQDLLMKGSGIDSSANTFNVPVYLDSTDAFSLGQKNITSYQFQFHITGSPLLTFVGTKMPSTMPVGWMITPAPGTGAGAGPPYTITGQGPALTNADRNDTLVYLVFAGAKSNDVEEAQIVIDADNCGDNVTYNGGNDTNFATGNYTVTLPAPAGMLNGGTVVFMDSCATIVGNNPHPTILSIAPAIPNPFTGSTAIQYTVPTDAPVTLELYDALGQKMKTLVGEVEKQGTYQLMMDATDLRGGSYFLRLQSNGTVCSQRIILNK